MLDLATDSSVILMSDIETLQRVTDWNKTYLVTHRACMDGSASALVFIWAGGKRENIVFIPAGGVERFVKESPLISRDVFLIFADIGVTVSKHADALEKRGNAIIIDHHASSKHLSEREWCHVNNDKCGSRLLAEYFEIDNHAINNFIAEVDDFDRGIFKSNLSAELAVWSAFMGQEDFIERFKNVEGRSESLWTSFERDVLRILLKNRDIAIENILKKSFVSEVFANDSSPVKVAYVITSDPNISVLLEKLLEKYPDAKIAAQINIDKAAVSLRSRKNEQGCEYDVSEFAKIFGGGGHKQASGHPISRDLLKKIAEEVHG